MSIKPSNITSSYLSAYTTQTLTFSDIINHSEYEASSVSLSGGYNITNETPSFSASPPIQEDGEDTTTTYATLTEGNINVGGTRSNASDLGIHTDIDTAHEKVEDLPDLEAILEEQKAMAAAANTVIETSGQVASDIAKAAAKAKAEAKEEVENKLKEAGTYEAYLALSKEKQELYLLGASSEYAEASITLEHWGVGGDYSRALSVVTNIIVGATSGQGNAQLATNAIAPYASQLIGDTFEHTDDPNKAAQLLSHAVLGAIIAYMNGGDAVSGAASATASELASMVLAKELYPEAFDENGNLVRSDLSEEQAESIVAITNAIGAITGGITGGDAVNASLGSFIGENAVVNNKVSVEQAIKSYQNLYKQCVASGYTDCNDMRVILVDGSTDNYRVVGSEFIDSPSPRDMITNVAFEAPEYVTLGYNILIFNGNLSINLYNGNVYTGGEGSYDASSKDYGIQFVGGYIINNGGTNKDRASGVDRFLDGYSASTGGCIGGCINYVTSFDPLNPFDGDSQIQSVEYGIGTISIGGSSGYNQIYWNHEYNYHPQEGNADVGFNPNDDSNRFNNIETP